MPLAIVQSRGQLGVFAPRVSVEVHLSGGLPSFTIVGLPEAAVRESRERVRAAIINSSFDFPMRRITVNLAPADLPKDGGRFDLPIAIGVLCASGQLPGGLLTGLEMIGELGLSGELKPVAGVLPAVIAADKEQNHCVVPTANSLELNFLHNHKIMGASHLLEVCEHVSDSRTLPLLSSTVQECRACTPDTDFAEIIGQHQAKRALEIAAAGGHHVLMVGSPGSGKTMLASRFPGILPHLTESERIESSVIHSISFGGKEGAYTPVTQRPFRNPHHSVSAVALAGGGSHPRPGEISLAHNGVLFLDELGEFDRRALEIMREPLESGTITISRAAQCVDYPARFQLIAAMNPCPNGCDVDQFGQCGCNASQVKRYRNRISAPLLDRIDIQLSVAKLHHRELIQPEARSRTGSAVIRERVESARAVQIKRQGRCNQQLQVRELDEICRIDKETQKFLASAFERLLLTARSYHRILKVARSIADLEHSAGIQLRHVSEAVSYRGFDQLLNRDRVLIG